MAKRSGTTIRLTGDAASGFMRSLGVELAKDRDFSDDEELYSCICCVCHKDFLGYKRRAICRKCSTGERTAAQAKQKGERDG